MFLRPMEINLQFTGEINFSHHELGNRKHTLTCWRFKNKQRKNLSLVGNILVNMIEASGLLCYLMLVVVAARQVLRPTTEQSPGSGGGQSPSLNIVFVKNLVRQFIEHSTSQVFCYSSAENCYGPDSEE